MNVTFVSTAPAAVAIVVVLIMLAAALKPDLRIGYRVFACFSFLFLCFSSFAVYREGALGFWTEHTRNLWGNQIWFDLLLMALAVWALILERASKVKMKLLNWLVLILCTGSVGVLLMVSRLLYLEGRHKTSDS